ncbi:hypothetical protein [Salinimonas iocasae]|uniref:Uncharacterized protein n=1 Tax=Salinimonas iocasae TaxID=2572577 RepID=A0A5B7YGJ8_9ALTE|nr:hypothetical protein [Salinimonas iocasae]QCZ94413.1 hypothetical protein FBQ74_13475 [Salinimonas iocasae]
MKSASELIRELSFCEDVPKKYIAYYPTVLIDPVLLPLHQKQIASITSAKKENARRTLKLECKNGIPSGTFGRISICYWQTQFKKLENTTGIEKAIEGELGKSQRQVFLDVVGKDQSGSRQLTSFYSSFRSALDMKIFNDERFTAAEISNEKEAKPFLLKDVKKSMPVDFRAFQLLYQLKSPLGIDLYLFLNMKNYSMNQQGSKINKFILWSTLEAVLFTERCRCKNLYEFKQRVIKALGHVVHCLPTSLIKVTDTGIAFRSGSTAVQSVA